MNSAGTFPIDLTKTRLQVQGQTHCMEVRYRGMFHALFRIGQEEGIRALYSGWELTICIPGSSSQLRGYLYNLCCGLGVFKKTDRCNKLNIDGIKHTWSAWVWRGAESTENWPTGINSMAPVELDGNICVLFFKP